jgi:REP element-mobilizing transposase RayT
MMPKPRYSQISLEATPYYHCISRCVRRAFLCGTDTLTGNSYEHRRQWVEDKMLSLSAVFALDICAYAVMSNHYHIVIHVNKATADNWTLDEVIERWHQLFSGNLLSQRYVTGYQLGTAELKTLEEIVNIWRKRLMDISWFMRILNEGIARQANEEDVCSGHFWEGRFKSQALLDEAALVACMAYVDLNPIRAKMASVPENADHTAIKLRITQAVKSKKPNHLNQQPNSLLAFAGNPRNNMPEGLPFRLTDYIELVEWSRGGCFKKTNAEQ